MNKRRKKRNLHQLTRYNVEEDNISELPQAAQESHGASNHTRAHHSNLGACILLEDRHFHKKEQEKRRRKI